MKRLPACLLLTSLWFTFSGLAAIAHPAGAVELAVLGPDNWDSLAPAGKEVDAIYGDFVLRNEQVVAVIAQPLSTRNANMTVRGVGGMLIDYTTRKRPNDQLSAYYAGAGKFSFTSPDNVRLLVDGKPAPREKWGHINGKKIVLEFTADATEQWEVTQRYILAKDDIALTIATELVNRSKQPVKWDLADSMRADKTFDFGLSDGGALAWAHDDWFRQAYGAVAPGNELRGSFKRSATVQFIPTDEDSPMIAPGERRTLSRRVLVADNLLELRGLAAKDVKTPVNSVSVRISDTAGPVRHAKLTLTRHGDQQPIGSGRSDGEGRLAFDCGPGEYLATVEAIGRPTVESPVKIAAGQQNDLQIKLQSCGYVVGRITDAKGGPIPCKVAFRPLDGGEVADFGPDSGEVAVQDLHYSHNGQFRQEIRPGKYRVIISYGPEYDAVVREIDVAAGKEAVLEARLVRSVDTKGWISSDFHSHSSPSGDNTSSQRGRVLNLLCEHIEFAPCTEHNRIDTYVPHLKALNVESIFATCTGMELTGGPLPVNHQNAFPLDRKPHTQDNGAPVTDVDPVVQVSRLAMWDNTSDKLVQMNHPNLPQILGDKNLDGKPDGGFEEMFGWIDVMEIHPPGDIFTVPDAKKDPKKRYAIFHWMQMLNLGYRVPGTVNTDAHYNHHGSGWLRNFIKCSTDDPAKIDEMEIVHESTRGHVVVSNGPFLEVSLQGKGEKEKPAIPGDEIKVPGGRCSLSVRVQCPNWFDINRVQVFLNGRPEPSLNFTRRTTPDRFGNEVVKFEATIPLELKRDTHVIVATTGEGLSLGEVMGADRGKTAPAAVANPVFVDVDGNGFQPNGDLLGVPLPIQDGHSPTMRKHSHAHGHDHHHEHDHEHDHAPAKRK